MPYKSDPAKSSICKGTGEGDQVQIKDLQGDLVESDLLGVRFNWKGGDGTYNCPKKIC